MSYLAPVDSSIPATTAAANFNSPGIYIQGCHSIGIQVTWTGLDAADATAKIQISNDNTNWNDYPSTSTTASTTPSNKCWDFPTGCGLKYMRVVWTKGSVAAGTFTVFTTVTRVIQ